MDAVTAAQGQEEVTAADAIEAAKSLSGARPLDAESEQAGLFLSIGRRSTPTAATALRGWPQNRSVLERVDVEAMPWVLPRPGVLRKLAGVVALAYVLFVGCLVVLHIWSGIKLPLLIPITAPLLAGVSAYFLWRQIQVARYPNPHWSSWERGKHIARMCAFAVAMTWIIVALANGSLGNPDKAPLPTAPRIEIPASFPSIAPPPTRPIGVPRDPLWPMRTSSGSLP
jgi:hypothetical protein